MNTEGRNAAPKGFRIIGPDRPHAPNTYLAWLEDELGDGFVFTKDISPIEVLDASGSNRI